MHDRFVSFPPAPLEPPPRASRRRRDGSRRTTGGWNGSSRGVDRWDGGSRTGAGVPPRQDDAHMLGGAGGRGCRPRWPPARLIARAAGGYDPGEPTATAPGIEEAVGGRRGLGWADRGVHGCAGKQGRPRGLPWPWSISSPGFQLRWCHQQVQHRRSKILLPVAGRSMDRRCSPSRPWLQPTRRLLHHSQVVKYMEGTEKNIMKDYNYGDLDINNGPRISIHRLGWYTKLFSTWQQIVERLLLKVAAEVTCESYLEVGISAYPLVLEDSSQQRGAFGTG